MKKNYLTVLFVSLLLLVTAPGGKARALPAFDTQPVFPIRAAFVYPWFPEAWDQHNIYPYTNFHPQAGYYDSSSPATIQAQIAAMQYGGIQAGILSWWGQGSDTDGRISTILANTAGSAFRWSLYYENESLGNPSAAQISADLTYIKNHYGSDPGFLRINGRFVIFVYADTSDACGMADRWKLGNTVNAYVVLKVFPGFESCASQPAGWHQYGPATAALAQGTHSYSISPGFWLKGRSVSLARDLSRWNMNIRDMVASGANFQLITTFNEWGEGTIVEAATEWASASGYGNYLDALHNNGVEGPPPTFVDVPHGHWAYDYIQSAYDAGVTGGCSVNPLQYCPKKSVTRAQMAIFLLRGKYGSGYTPPLVGSSTGFDDVPTDYWAAAWIKALASLGITNGCGGGNYCPEQSVTRDQMAVFLLRAEHGGVYIPPAGTGTLFADVPAAHWAVDWIEQLALEGITGGCGDGDYCPSDPVTRASMAVFLVRVFNLP
jgi:hypothetical protein